MYPIHCNFDIVSYIETTRIPRALHQDLLFPPMMKFLILTDRKFCWYLYPTAWNKPIHVL